MATKIIVGFSEESLPSATELLLESARSSGNKVRLPASTGDKYMFVWWHEREEPAFINLKGAPWLPFFNERRDQIFQPADEDPTHGSLFVTTYRQKSGLLSGEQISVM